MSTLDKFSLKISVKFVWFGGRQILPTTIGLDIWKGAQAGFESLDIMTEGIEKEKL